MSKRQVKTPPRPRAPRLDSCDADRSSAIWEAVVDTLRCESCRRRFRCSREQHYCYGCKRIVCNACAARETRARERGESPGLGHGIVHHKSRRSLRGGGRGRS